MGTWFYTDAQAQQLGPVNGARLRTLSEEGTVLAHTLVWKEGMPDWARFREVAGEVYGADQEGAPVRLGVCAYSARVYPEAEMIPYGEALIGLEYKDEFIRQLMEVGSVEIQDATEKRLEYIGFWWRCLSSLLDYMIKMVPSWLCMIPYYITAAMMGASVDSENAEDFGMMTGMMMASAAFGGLAMLGISIFYETWMVGKYQATLGKMIIGAKVVTPDGSRLTYGRAFIRWLAKKPLNYIIVLGIPQLLFVLFMVAVSSVSGGGGDGESATFVMTMLGGAALFVFSVGIASGVYWMAAFDSEKRALHDRISSTRVVKK